MSAIEIVLLASAFVGVCLILSTLPLFQPSPSLAQRLRRFDVDARLREQRALIAEPSRHLLPWAPLDAALRPLLEDLIAPVQHFVLRDGVFGRSTARQLRVIRPGTPHQAFVARQLLWGSAALVVFLIGFASSDQLGPVNLLASLLAGVVGFLVPWLTLRQQARARKRRILAELPHVARLLAMTMSASLPLDVALAYTGAHSRGPLAALIVRAARLAATHACTLLDELTRTAELEELPELVSFVALLHAADQQGLQLVPALETMSTTLQQRSAARLLATAERRTINMIFPLALVLVPVLIVVTLVPAVLALYAVVHGGG